MGKSAEQPTAEAPRQPLPFRPSQPQVALNMLASPWHLLRSAVSAWVSEMHATCLALSAQQVVEGVPQISARPCLASLLTVPVRIAGNGTFDRIAYTLPRIACGVLGAVPFKS